MNLMELFVKIGVDDQASGKVDSITGKIGGGLKTAAGIGVKAITAASTAIIGLTGLAVKNYAEYEQLVGGVETLFKDSAGKVQEYAANAYMTAGMSANDYMNTVTSFSASLLQSLGNDTAAASDYADRAITDMSDNANKMGTDMQRIQDAYQGFAKQNYTMLDNLKLGYGGTKTEMERLIADANRVKEANGEMGDLSIESFADVTEAIHIMQTEMGITGTTAKEAATTISGSIGMMRAAWSNLVTGIADDNADFDKLMDDFVDSAGTAAGNVIPRIEKALVGVGKLIEELFPVIMDRVPQIITKTLPKILTSAGNIVLTLVNGIIKNAPRLLNTALEVILTFANGLVKALPKMVTSIVSIVLKIVEVLTKPSTLSKLVNAAVKIIIALAEGLINALPKLLATAPKIVANLVAAIIANAPKLLTAAAKLIATIVKGIGNTMKSIVSAGARVVNNLWSGISNKLSFITSRSKTIGSRILSGIRSGIKGVTSIGSNLVEGLWNGVYSRIQWIAQKMASFGKQVIKSLKNFFGIHSPSTVMRDEIGRFLAEGVAVGFMENDPMTEIEASLNNGVRSMNVPSVGMYGRGGSFGSGEVSIIQNIYSQAQTAADLMQEAIYQQEKAVYLGV